MTPPNPTHKLTITLPKRYCANPACAKLLPQGHKYPTCSFRCKLAVDAQLAEIEAADKAEEARPF